MRTVSVFDEAIERLDKSIEKEKRSTTIFEYEPVPLSVFVKDKQFLGLPPLSIPQQEAVEIATQVYFPETMKELGWQTKRYVKELVLLWGKGSGKDYISRVIHLRIAYLLLCLKNPQGYFYHPDMRVGMEHIHLLNTASTKEQAGNVFFAPLRRYVRYSPFFRNKADVLTTEVRFEKGIYLYSGHSQAEAMEGLNLIAVILDEIAAFKTDEEVADIKRMRLRKNIPQSAGSLYDFAHTSVSTRFPEIGKVILLSFPRFRGDFIMQRYEAGLRNKRTYTSKKATYEANPTKKKSDFADEKRTKPELYSARIECNPGVAEDAFFKNEVAIRRAFKLEIANPVDKSTNRFKSWFMCKDEFPRYGHVDLAKNRCRAAFSFVHAFKTESHKIKMEDKEVIVDLPLIRLDVIMYFEAPFGGEVNFEEIQDRILEFKEERGFRIELLTFDGYNSVQMMQNLDKKGIAVDEQSVDRTRDAYETWQDCLYEGRFISYYNKILVEDEIPFLIDEKGRKIVHRQGKNKDGTDAVAGAVHNCVVDEPWGDYDFWVDESGGKDDT
jgi:hypothetical protein